MSNQKFVLAITGPTGSGKSTVAERLAKQLEECVNIDVDNVKHMIVSGFYVDEENPEDESGWGFSEWALVGESVGLLTQNFLKHGFSVIINGYIDDLSWRNIEKLVNINHRILLLPQINEVVSRDAGRRKDIKMGEFSVERHHKHFSSDAYFKDFLKIDSTRLSVDETIGKIKEEIQNDAL